MNMRIDLTGLADLANAQLAKKGRPLDLPVDDILPDPENARNADDDGSTAAIEAQEELDADVAERGVKTPISVRPHPTVPGKYIINYGHRRYKSARRNNLATIPGFVDEKFDSYDQVNENELHARLTPRALALFIRGRLEAGDTKREIAHRMRKKNQTFITEHLAMIDAPQCVNDAYATGVTSARTLYDLRQAWEQFPAAIDAWCRSTSHITRDGIKEALAGFRHDEADATGKNDVKATGRHGMGFRHDEKTVSLADAVPPAGSQENCQGDGAAKPSTDKERLAAQREPSLQETQLPVSSKPALVGGKQKASLPGILVQYKGKPARISPDVVVPIVMEGSGDVLNVPLAMLVFQR